MRYLVGFICVLALGVVGCGETTGTRASGGTGGTGGVGFGHSDGGAGGTGGTGGDGGSAGMGGGGMAGSGGSGLITEGLWTGSGQGADGAVTICFNVLFSVVEDRYFLRKPQVYLAECNHSLEVAFSDCEGGFLTTGEIPFVGNSFRTQFDQAGSFHDISGTFDGNTASGEATTGSASGGRCSGPWDATPSP
jgi:hypothetical protein